MGLLSWLIYFGKKIKDWDLVQKARELELENRKMISSQFEKMSTGRGPLSPSKPPNKEDIPEKIKELMGSSPNHPEVAEIDSSDMILGVRFEAENYPPGFADDDE